MHQKIQFAWKNNEWDKIMEKPNDNSNAIRFYQKRGFEWIGFYKNTINVSRKIKPELPEFGIDHIPIKHEIEFEYRLD